MLYELRTPRGILYAILLSLSGCTNVIDGDFCSVYLPVYPDYETDSPETIRQIDKNNVVYDAFCVKK